MVDMIVIVNASGSFTVYLDGVKKLTTKVFSKVLALAEVNEITKFKVSTV